MQRREMIEQILEQVESELDELTNTQLKNLVEAFEHHPILGSVVENMDDLDDDEEDPELDEDDEELPVDDED